MNVQETNYSTKKPKKRYKKKKRNFKRLLFWVKFILTSALLIASIVTLALSPAFNISKIEVYGNEYCKQSDIVTATGIVIGSNGFKTIGSNVKNILTFRYGVAEENIIKNFPYVKSVVVRYKIPEKVKVSITERKPAFIVSYMSSKFIIDDEKYVLEAVGKQPDKKLPVLNGLKFEPFEIGQTLKLTNPEAFSDALKVIEAVKKSDEKSNYKMYSAINAVDVSDRGKIRVLVDSRITVDFGNLRDIDYRVSFCKMIISEKLTKEDKGFLDMSIENPNYRPAK